MELDVNLAIGGVFMLPLLFGLVEFFKNVFNLDGKVVTVMSACLGTLIGVLFQAYPLIPEPYAQWVGYGLFGLAVGLGASGFYKFATRNE